ncbi:MAG: methyltransferase domain-containing protein [Actinobacteria bacterium]|nr:methyltransferase domain-containing protein [Actinomycetota bacterium]
MTRIDPVAAAGFGAGADVYERARPSYPAAAVEWLAERCGIGRGAVVADVGAGTGKLTRLLVPTGARVVAVEPVPAMRAKLRETTPEVEVVDGTAESLPFADGELDVITVAQAFHWFDHDVALPELHRVLRPGGSLVLVWNMRDLTAELQVGVEELLGAVRSGPDAQRQSAWRAPLERSLLFGEAETGAWRFDQPMTAQGLCDRVASTSYVAVLPDAERQALERRVRALAAGREEPFALSYLTEVAVIPRTGDRGDAEGGTSIKG